MKTTKVNLNYTNDVIDFYDIITKKNNYEYRYF